MLRLSQANHSLVHTGEVASLGINILVCHHKVRPYVMVTATPPQGPVGWSPVRDSMNFFFLSISNEHNLYIVIHLLLYLLPYCHHLSLNLLSQDGGDSATTTCRLWCITSAASTGDFHLADLSTDDTTYGPLNLAVLTSDDGLCM